MPNIKRIIVKALSGITLILVAFMLFLAVRFQVSIDQLQARESAESRFYQIEQILAENERDLEELTAEYIQTCLYSAELIAYVIQYDPSLLGSVVELKELARIAEVDEIHIFDATGRIFTGTNPEYYDFTFDSGEQIGFFKPLLEDKSLQLCQPITPNTAEGKLMQYSALWDKNGEYIVQIGMEPDNVMKAAEKNELSYIFSLLSSDPGVALYAFDRESGEIVGATATGSVGKNMADLGLTSELTGRLGEGIHTTVSGVDSYCVFTEIGENLIGYVVSIDVLYEEIWMKVGELALSLLLIAVILVFVMTLYVDKFVIKGIRGINEKLRAITAGDLNEKVNVQSSLEFFELSSHINEMIRSLLATTDKLSYILDKANMHIGVYEYTEKMKDVRFTEYVPKILNLDSGEARQLSSDYRLFQEYVERLRGSPVPGEEGTFRLEGSVERYVQLEEITKSSDTLGIVRDVTEEVITRRKLESERDHDLLTGLYNRRGLDSRLSALFEAPEELGFGAMIMIDADGLKGINDMYGHEKGDVYLRQIAEAIGSLDLKSCVAARQGGDEFVLFLYHYNSEAELLEGIEALKHIQNNGTVYLDRGVSVPLRFSFGYSLTNGHADHKQLLRQADEQMYESKRRRKEEAASKLLS